MLHSTSPSLSPSFIQSFIPPPLTSLPAPLLSSVFLGSGCNCWWSMGCISTAWLFPGLQCCSCWSFWLRLQVTVICFNILFCSVTPPPPPKKKPLLKNGHISIVELGLIQYDIDVRCQKLITHLYTDQESVVKCFNPYNSLQRTTTCTCLFVWYCIYVCAWYSLYLWVRCLCTKDFLCLPPLLPYHKDCLR